MSCLHCAAMMQQLVETHSAVTCGQLSVAASSAQNSSSWGRPLIKSYS